MLLQDFHCDSASHSVAKTVAVEYSSCQTIIMLGVKEWQEWELVHSSLTYNQTGRRKEKKKEPETVRIWFKLSCAPFFTVKNCQKVLLIAPVTANLPSLPDENSNTTQHLHQKLPFVGTKPAGAAAKTFTIMQSANNSQHKRMHAETMCVHFPSESTNPVTTFTLQEAISWVAQLMKFESRSGPVIESLSSC